MFTKQEVKVKDFIGSTYVPAIHQLLSEANPLAYVRSGGRCCKQIAYLLERYLSTALPDYEWSAWESTFHDDGETYRHAWTYGKHKEEAKGIVLDYGKLQDEFTFFLASKENIYPEVLLDYYGEDDSKYLDEEWEDERERLLPKGLEYFTGKEFDVLYQELMKNLKIH